MKTTMPLVISVLIAVAFSAQALGQEPKIGVPVVDLDKGHQLIGKLHVPLGQVVRVQGFVVDGQHKGFEGGANFRVQRIDGKAVQEHIQLPLTDTTYAVPPKEGAKLSPKAGESYELEGYETGGYVGHPGLGEAWIQTTRHYFRIHFCFVRGKSIPAVTFSPADFVGRRAMLQGIAQDKDGRAIMDGGSWQVIVNAKGPWPKAIVGKKVETLGMYNPTKTDYANPRATKVYNLVDGSSRPVELEDQLGQKVELRGTATSRNGIWWFEFRDIDMYVEDLEQMPGWNEEYRGHPIVIRGVLDKAKLPRVDQISVKADRNLRDHYIVRQASWAPTSPLLSPELPTLLKWIATSSIDDKDE